MYQAGVAEHHSYLGDLSELELIDNAMAGAIDRFCYLYALREKLLAFPLLNLSVLVANQQKCGDRNRPTPSFPVPIVLCSPNGNLISLSSRERLLSWRPHRHFTAFNSASVLNCKWATRLVPQYTCQTSGSF